MENKKTVILALALAALSLLLELNATKAVLVFLIAVFVNKLKLKQLQDIDENISEALMYGVIFAVVSLVYPGISQAFNLLVVIPALVTTIIINGIIYLLVKVVTNTFMK